MRAESSFPDLEQQLVERRLSEYVLEFNRGQNLKPFSTSHVERSRIPAIPLTSKSLIHTAHYIDSIQICSKLKWNRKTAVIRLKSLCESFSHDSLFFATSFLEPRKLYRCIGRTGVRELQPTVLQCMHMHHGMCVWTFTCGLLLIAYSRLLRFSASDAPS